MPDYLLEIGTEEIPAKFMPGALNQLQELAGKILDEKRIKYGSIETMGTPRRLALLIKDLREKGEDLQEEVRGPAKRAAFDHAGTPTKAARGFARSQGVPVENLLITDTGNGEYVFAVREIMGRPTEEILPEMALKLIDGLNFPKPMRWGEKGLRFARPIRWLVSLLDDRIIPFELENLKAGRRSRGHRFLGQKIFSVKTSLSYKEQLQENFVLVDHKLRKEICWKQIREAARSVNGTVEPDEELLDEVTQLLEWPTALVGSFEKSYLEIPEEVVITPMREHQRYFPVRSKDGKLLNMFITVRNGNEEYLDIVKAGNEKVLRARLADARFFWDEDKKQKLEDYLPRLEKIVFQESLGTVAQKTQRIKANVDYLCDVLKPAREVVKNAQRAALLVKADLVTGMVYEFPELQGIMGHYYALLSGEAPEVAQAILEHYQPRFSGDRIPESLEGALAGIADKLDTIAGCFAIGIEPTGSQDPYALRRQAMGICLIIKTHNLDLDLSAAINKALDNYKGILPEDTLGAVTLEKIREFFRARLKNILTDEGHRYDVVDAVLDTDLNNLPAVLKRAGALSIMREDQGFRELHTAFTRANNLAKKKVAAVIEPAAFIDETEKVLFEALNRTEQSLGILLKRHDFTEALTELSKLAKPINDFFNAVMVMAEDEKVRNNRLGLLAKVVELTRTVGNLSKLS
jgi:glycyl-tRNA synthetase beta chain